jgi:hypothetical protein
MTYSLELVKQIIHTFIDEHQSSSAFLTDRQAEANLRVNRPIFDIESFLVDIRKEYNINGKLDTSIVSENILSNFNSIRAKDAFTKVDYQLNFLHFLATRYSSDWELYQIIDEFIQSNACQLQLADIVITNTGVTRCRTNTRFALNALRDLGLVLSRDPDDRRSWSPSIAGLLVLFNIQLFPEEFESLSEEKNFDSLRTRKENARISTCYQYDPTIIYSINLFRKDAHLYSLLQHFKDTTIEKYRSLIESIMNEYIEFVQDGLKITPDGIKITDRFKKKTKLFLQKITQPTFTNAELHESLFTHFNKK